MPDDVKVGQIGVIRPMFVAMGDDKLSTLEITVRC